MSAHTVGRRILGFVAAWAIGVALLVGWFWPRLPHSKTGWIALVLLGPPLWFLAEILSEKFWSSRRGLAIAHHPVPAVRILGGVCIVLMFGGLVFLAAHFIVRH